MKIINKLTLRHMKLNKKRTLVTQIGIVITVAMITAVSTVCSTAMDYMGRMEEEDSYRFHVKFGGYSYKDNDTILDELEVKNYALSRNVSEHLYEDYVLRI